MNNNEWLSAYTEVEWISFYEYDGSEWVEYPANILGVEAYLTTKNTEFYFNTKKSAFYFNTKRR